MAPVDPLEIDLHLRVIGGQKVETTRPEKILRLEGTRGLIAESAHHLFSDHWVEKQAQILQRCGIIVLVRLVFPVNVHRRNHTQTPQSGGRDRAAAATLSR
jgi:hypothetical protein